MDNSCNSGENDENDEKDVNSGSSWLITINSASE